RERQDDPTQLMTSRLTRLPPLAMRAAMKLGESLSYDLGLDLSRFGLPYDAFGSAMVTNVGGFGLSVGHAPLFPPSRVPVVLTVGAVREAPAVEGDRVVVRPTLTIGASFDHRLLDGFQAGKLARRLREVLEGPGPELR
ncbi:MAG: 2-oxo acid dehydrogenase subunit E2, partial [Sorangiineae bacterium]|nr:2-oxo acid dehydrogenase subunit E2 [Sorangiineae bacterium]